MSPEQDRLGQFSQDELTCDAFLGGRLHLWQPKTGYRAGIDPVLLAASVPAGPGQSVLELGCGSGVAALCLAARVPDVRLTGVEVQPAYAALARRNAQAAEIHLEVVQADLRDLPADLRQRRFDHVLANPPYFSEGTRTRAQDAGREMGRAEQRVALEVWATVAAKRVVPKGTITFIQTIERLPDLLRALPGDIGSLEVQPLASRAGRGAKLVLLRAKKGGKADFRLHPPVVVHAGPRHEEKVKDYNPMIEAVLRDAAPFPWANDAQTAGTFTFS